MQRIKKWVDCDHRQHEMEYDESASVVKEKRTIIVRFGFRNRISINTYISYIYFVMIIIICLLTCFTCTQPAFVSLISSEWWKFQNKTLVWIEGMNNFLIARISMREWEREIDRGTQTKGIATIKMTKVLSRKKKSWSGTGSCVHMLWTMSVLALL